MSGMKRFIADCAERGVAPTKEKMHEYTKRQRIPSPVETLKQNIDAVKKLGGDKEMKPKHQWMEEIAEKMAENILAGKMSESEIPTELFDLVEVAINGIEEGEAYLKGKYSE